MVKQSARVTPSPEQLCLAYAIMPFERAIGETRKELTAVENLLMEKKAAYRAAVATACTLPEEALRFSNEPCKNAIVQHCVFALERQNPMTHTCVFCGSTMERHAAPDQ